MSRKTCISIFITVLMLLVLCGCGAQETVPAEVPSPTLTPEPTPVPTPEPLNLSIVSGEEHPAFLALEGNGCFQPYARVTRLEASLAFCRAVDGWPVVSQRFSDLRAGQEGYAEAASLCYAGVFPVAPGEKFSPRQSISREELVGFLELLCRSLSGEELSRVEALTADVREGALTRNGTAEDTVSRSEFAIVMVRLSGREPHEAALVTGNCVPLDVGMDHYAWLYISDAVTEGPVEIPAEGVYRVGSTLYGVGADGELLRDTDYGVWTFGPDGRYTTGDADLDEYLRSAISACGADKLSGADAVKKAYLHVKYDYEYLVTPEDMIVEEPAATGWENVRALRFFRHGGGTCYGFAAAFGLLARSLGEHAYIVSAQVNQYYAPHGFVVIPENGVDWIYDVEMEATRMERHDDLDLFRIKNYGIYNYWYTPDW